MLLTGVEPSRILCLTYTKAAAGEMSNRVFDILGRWVDLSDEELRQELAAIEAVKPSSEQLERARILFARALETPGGLKIQTNPASATAAAIPGTAATRNPRPKPNRLSTAIAAIE